MAAIIYSTDESKRGSPDNLNLRLTWTPPIKHQLNGLGIFPKIQSWLLTSDYFRFLKKWSLDFSSSMGLSVSKLLHEVFFTLRKLLPVLSASEAPGTWQRLVAAGAPKRQTCIEFPWISCHQTVVSHSNLSFYRLDWVDTNPAYAVSTWPMANP